MSASLMLPVPPSSSRSSACDIAERSNTWAEGKLQEKKSALDKKLHQTVVKMNVDKLDLIADLARMKKSASTGALEKLARDSAKTKTDSTKDGHLTVSKSANPSRSLRNSPMLDRKGQSSGFHFSPSSSRKSGSASAGKSRSGKKFPHIEIHVSKDWSSSEDEEYSPFWNPPPSTGRNKQRVSARYDNCHRSQDALVQNVKRRFAKQVNTEQLIQEDRLNIGKNET